MEAEKEIWANGKQYTYQKTITEDKNGNWNSDGLSIQDGYVVLHNGSNHLVYWLKKTGARLSEAQDKKVKEIVAEIINSCGSNGMPLTVEQVKIVESVTHTMISTWVLL